MASMTQLINSSGVSICMAGLPETELFFGREMQLARRSVGLSYTALPYDGYFVQFCETLCSYQYVAHPSKLTPGLIELLYECTGGIIAIVVSIIMEAQQIAILTGKEELNKETILMAYNKRLKNVRDFVQVKSKKRSQTSSIVNKNTADISQKSSVDEAGMDILIAVIIDKARSEGLDAVELLKGQEILIEEENV